MTITTTLNRIRAQGPCSDGWNKLLSGLGKKRADDEVLSYARIVEINGIDDALWACRSEPQHAKEWRLFAVWCARQVEHLMNDPRSITACNVAERFAYGMATREELGAALDATWGAARGATWDAAWDAAWGAARGAAWDVARDAALDAAWGAARGATWDAAWDAAWDVARGVARGAQTAKFLEIVGE
jgi:hypothetical protein